MGRGAWVGLAWGLALVGCVAAQAQDRVIRFTTSGARNGQSFFSPDGSRISFVSDREEGWQVWSVAADGGDLRRLTNEVDPVGWPSWSPDGSAILFYGQRRGRYRLLRLDLVSGNVTLLDSLDWDAFRPMADAPGRRLLFDAVDRSAGTGHDIYLWDLESGRVSPLARDAGYDSDARWSPDGRRIAFHSDRGRERFHLQVYVMNEDGGNVRQVTRGPGHNAYPSWSPNGRCLVYTSEADGNRDLWVVDLQDGGSERMTWSTGFDGDPAWRPTGGILFSTDRFGGVELALLRVEGALRRRCEA